jgi:hypothetical protein
MRLPAAALSTICFFLSFFLFFLSFFLFFLT